MDTLSKEVDSPPVNDTGTRFKVISFVSSNYKSVQEYDAAIEDCINRLINDGWELEDSQAAFSATATLAPAGQIPNPTRIKGGFEVPTQALQLVVNQIAYTQLLFIRE